MLPSDSKYASNKFAYQCLYILNNKERLNGLKSITKMQKIKSQFKYQSRIYNVQRNSGVNHRGMKIRCRNKLSPSIKVIKGKTSTYTSNGC